MVKAVLSEDGVIVPPGPLATSLLNEGYGEKKPEGLLLDGIEACYLVSKGKIKVVDGEGNVLDLPRLVSFFVSKDRMFWVRFEVYFDLKQ